MSTNITTTTTKVNVTEQSDKIIIVDNIQGNTVNVTPSTDTVVEIKSAAAVGSLSSVNADIIVQPFSSITASGDISASGTLSIGPGTSYINGALTGMSSIVAPAANVIFSAATINGNITAVNGTFNQITASSDISASGNLILDGNITSSGNISASGALTASAIHMHTELNTSSTSSMGGLLNFGTNTIEKQYSYSGDLKRPKSGSVRIGSGAALEFSGPGFGNQAQLSSIGFHTTLPKFTSSLSMGNNGDYPGFVGLVGIEPTFGAPTSTAVGIWGNKSNTVLFGGADKECELKLQTGRLQYYGWKAIDQTPILEIKRVLINSRPEIKFAAAVTSSKTITATKFYGDGSTLSNIPAPTSYLNINITGSISASADISASGNLEISSSLTFGDGIAKIIGPGNNDFIQLATDNIDFYINNSEVINIDNDSINLNVSNQPINTIITADDGTNLFKGDATNNVVRLNDHIIMSPGAPADYTNRLLVSGSSKFIGNVTASGDISASGKFIGDGKSLTTVVAKHFGFDDTQGLGRFFPLQAGTAEQNLTTSRQGETNFIMPWNGTVKEVVLRCEDANTTELRFWTGSDSTIAAGYQVTSSAGQVIGELTNFSWYPKHASSGAPITLNKGEWFAIYGNPDVAWQSVGGYVIIEYDLSSHNY